ncbi:Uncharacterised protein [uncultured archaeon]|nr:Uncharacterised protein [uncultured archaeon]
MGNSDGSRQIRQSLGSQSKVTLADRLRNVRKNFVKNPWQFSLPVSAAFLIYSSINSGLTASKISRYTEGYKQAYSQVQNVTSALTNDLSWAKPAINPNIFEPIKKSIGESIPKYGGEAGSNAMTMAKAAQASFYDSSTNTAQMVSRRKDLMGKLEGALKPLPDSNAGSILGSIIYGALATIAGVVGLKLIIEDGNFEDYNEEKKRLKRSYQSLLKEVDKALKDGRIDEVSVNRLGEFFTGLDYSRFGKYDLGSVVDAIRSGLDNKKNLGALEVLAKRPTYYAERGIGSVFNIYETFRKADKRNPLPEGGKVKSRKDLVVRLMSEEDITDFSSLRAVIEHSLDYASDQPEYLEAILTKTRSVQELSAAINFSSYLSSDLINTLRGFYLTHKESPALPSGDIYVLGDYAGRRISAQGMSPEDSIRFLQSVDVLDAMVQKDRIFDRYYVSDSNKYDFVLDMAVNALAKNRALSKHVLLSIDSLHDLPAEQREIHSSIYSRGFLPTDYLVDTLTKSEDRQKELDRWETVQRENAHGKFDPKDKLRMNLEYTHYFLENVKIGKNRGFSSYQNLIAYGSEHGY